MPDTLFAAFQARFQAFPSRPALANAAGAGVTFAELDALSAHFAGALAARGVGAGDRVVAQVEKSVGAVALYLACLRLGAIFAPLNTAYTPAEVAYFLNDAEPKLFVARPGTAQQGDAPVAELGDHPGSPFWAEALGAPPRFEIASLSADDLAALVYTSGTTGRSKGAMLSHGNLLSNAGALSVLWGFREDDVLIHALPIFHVHGLFVALHTAFLNAIPTIFLPKFDAAEVLALLPKATLLMGVPTFYTRLVAEPGLTPEACAGMRLFISGSAPLLAETHRAFETRSGHRILERYGMTEAGMIASNPLEGERIAGTVGYALPDVDVRLSDETGSRPPPGTPGMVEIRGPNVFKGYWRMPEKTAEDFRDGWFVTGDVGLLSEDGRLTLVGRAKDLIISGGFNIYPVEIEEAIDALAGVRESAVIAAPHGDLGEAVVAVIVREPGAALDAAAVETALADRLARFKRPRAVIFADDLPRNAMGKVQKAVLRERYSSVFR